MAADEEERGRATHQLTIDVPRMGDMFIPFYINFTRLLEALYDEKYIDRKVLRQVREVFDENYTLNEEFYKKERSLLGKFQHALFGGEEPDPDKMQVAIDGIGIATGKLGQRDTEAAEKALEGVIDPEKREEIWNEDWTFTTVNLASVLNSSLRDMDLDEVTEENGFPEIATFYMESQQWIDQYYDLHETLRDQYLEENRWTVALLYFWGRWKANIPDDIREAVEDMAHDYNVPHSAIPALQE